MSVAPICHLFQFLKTVSLNYLSDTHSGTPRWISENRQHIYGWDGLHGEVEVYSRRGFHLGVVDCDGSYIGNPVKGSKIDV